MRPAIIGTRSQDIDLVIGLRPLLGGIERTVRPEVDALHVAVPVRIDVADDPGESRIVVWYRTVQVETQRFTHISEVTPLRSISSWVGKR